MFAAETSLGVSAGGAGWMPRKMVVTAIGVAIAIEVAVVAGLIGLWAESHALQLALAARQMPVMALSADPKALSAESR